MYPQYIRSRSAAKCLRPYNAGTAENVNVTIYTESSGDVSQRWSVMDLGNGYYTILNWNAKKSIQPVNQQGTNNTVAVIYTTDPDQLRRASDHYKATFNDAWVNQQTDAGLLKLITKYREHLDQYAVTGFMNLPTALIRGLQAAGCSWGGAWRNSKDFMHFEI